MNLGHVGVCSDVSDLKDATYFACLSVGIIDNKGNLTDRAKASNGGGLPSSRGAGAIHSVKGVLPNVYDASETYSSIPSDASDPAQVLEGGKPAGATRTS